MYLPISIVYVLLLFCLTQSLSFLQLESIGLVRMPTNYRRVILDCLCSQLSKLNIHGCINIDPLVELLPIKQIGTIIISQCTLIPLADAAALIHRFPRAILDNCPIQFLPELQELIVKNTCLGYWLRLFECRRPSLIKCIWSCSHIGLRPVSCYDWIDTPSLWPNLKVLGILDSTLNALKSIAPHLNEFEHLQKLIVSATTPSQIGSMSTSYVSAQIGHPLPIGLRVETWGFYSTCCPHHQKRRQNLL